MAVGASTILGSFAARLGVDTNDYAKGMLQAQAITSVFGQTFANFVANPLLGSVDIFKKVVGHLHETSTGILSNAEALQRLRDTTGASTTLLQALISKMDEAHGAGEKASQALIKMTGQLALARQGSAETAKTFEALGIDLDRLGTTDQVFAQIVEGISRMTSEADRNRAAMVVFGEEVGPKLVNTIGGGADALHRMIQEAQDLSRVLRPGVIDPLAQTNTEVYQLTRALGDVEKLLLAEVIAAAVKEYGSIAEAIKAFTRGAQELIPVAQKLGEDIGTIAGNAQDARDAIDGMLDRLKTLKLMNDGFQQTGFAQYMSQGGAFGPGIYLLNKQREALEGIDPEFVAAGAAMGGMR